ncbi:NAD(P)H-flavin reductase [Marinomonas spartinae]|uniref:NAD(P)H-flavin reductase n=1 Tax=Marinomonas spartinae TaxID=1792290 RepID=UPI0018F162E1|nr:NAD(P)H-flavin reductase [Marinomonas spartinae]MBJ7556744.1 NAD(P)H-flavin reductase [Marinomonas spartinae]
MKDVIATVNSVALINHNVYEVTLQVEEMTFIAGQYLMIALPSGEKVPYSIGSAPHELPKLSLYILVSEPDSLAQKVIEHIKNQVTIQLKIPGGDCHIACDAFQQHAQQAKPVLLIAGGTGFAQMKSIYESLQAQNYQGNISFYWGVRTPEDVFMTDWIQQAQHQHTTASFNVVVNEANMDWQGRTGWLYEAILEDHPDLSDSLAIFSGSVNMVYGTLDQLENHYLKTENCLSDVFAFAPHPNKPVL